MNLDFADMEATLKEVPLYKQRFPGEVFFQIRKNPLSFLLEMSKLGDCSVLHNGPVPSLYLLNHPELFKEVLVTKHESFIKGRAVQLMGLLVGKGLGTSEGVYHRQQRKLVLPAFQHSKLTRYGEMMVEKAVKRHYQWKNNRILSIEQEMMQLTLEIVAKTLFSAEVAGPESGGLPKAFNDFQEAFVKIASPFAEILMKLPLPETRKIKRARKTFDATVYRIIEEHRQNPDAYDDLLSMLLAAQDEETGKGMTDEQVRDESVTLFIGGHETTAIGLTWTWYLLSQNPDIEQRFHDELDRELGGRTPTFADIPRLTYTRQIFSEVLRLYPPAWLLNRETVEDVVVGDYLIPKGSTVDLSPYILHRDERFWPEPLKFDPDRFLPGKKGITHKFAFLPFSYGVRGCIGEQFTWTEAILLMATLGQRWKFRLIEDDAVDIKPLVTLRPERSIPMKALARS